MMYICSKLVSPEGHTAGGLIVLKTFTERLLPALELRKLLNLSEETATVGVHMGGAISPPYVSMTTPLSDKGGDCATWCSVYTSLTWAD